MSVQVVTKNTCVAHMHALPPPRKVILAQMVVSQLLSGLWKTHDLHCRIYAWIPDSISESGRSLYLLTHGLLPEREIEVLPVSNTLAISVQPPFRTPLRGVLAPYTLLVVRAQDGHYDVRSRRNMYSSHLFSCHRSYGPLKGKDSVLCACAMDHVGGGMNAKGLAHDRVKEGKAHENVVGEVYPLPVVVETLFRRILFLRLANFRA